RGAERGVAAARDQHIEFARKVRHGGTIAGCGGWVNVRAAPAPPSEPARRTVARRGTFKGPLASVAWEPEAAPRFRHNTGLKTASNSSQDTDGRRLGWPSTTTENVTTL